MAYTITPTNGQNPIIVADGTLNTSTSLTLVGKNYPSYGSILDQNLFRLLENSANSVAPTAPVTGEIFWNTSNNSLSVWNGTIWRTLGSVTVSPANSAPTSTTIGDLWWDSTNGELKGYDSTLQNWKLIGPMGGLANISSQTISDGNYNHTCMVFKLGGLGTTYMIFSTDAAFSPSPAIDGFQTIYPGLNLPSTAFLANAKFYGQANDSVTLGGIYPNSFLRNDQNSVTTGTITIQNNNGLTIGQNNFNLNVFNNVNSVISSVTPGGLMNFDVTSSGGTNIDAMDIYPNGNVVANFDLVVRGSIKSGGSSDFLITSTTPSINTLTGALQVRGGTGIVGNLNVGGPQNYVVGNLTAGNVNSNATVSATNIAGTLVTSAQPNITSVGTLSNLTVSGSTNIGAPSNLKISGGGTQLFLTSDGTSCSWAQVVVLNDTNQLTNGAGFVYANVVNGYLTSSVAASTYAPLNGAAFTGSISVTGTISATSTISSQGDIIAYSSSDLRLKTDIEPITGALDKVVKLNGITYSWNEIGASLFDDDVAVPDREAGVIAQEVEAVLPEVVTTRDNGMLAVRYERIIPLLIEAIKELKIEINALKSLN